MGISNATRQKWTCVFLSRLALFSHVPHFSDNTHVTTSKVQSIGIVLNFSSFNLHMQLVTMSYEFSLWNVFKFCPLYLYLVKALINSWLDYYNNRKPISLQLIIRIVARGIFLKYKSNLDNSLSVILILLSYSILEWPCMCVYVCVCVTCHWVSSALWWLYKWVISRCPVFDGPV